MGLWRVGPERAYPMALQLAEFLHYNPQERRAGKKLPLDSPERRSMLAKKLAEVRAKSQNKRKEKQQCQTRTSSST